MLIVTGGHLDFECTKGVGMGIYCGGEGGEKKRGNLAFLRSMSGNPDSGNKSGKSLLVEYRIREYFACGIWNPGL